jgi:hypothetical protein
LDINVTVEFVFWAEANCASSDRENGFSRATLLRPMLVAAAGRRSRMTPLLIVE